MVRWGRAAIAASALVTIACDGSDPPPLHESDQSTGASDLESLLERATDQYRASEFDSARTIWLHVVESSRQQHDSFSEASALQNLALVSRRLGDYSAARRFGEKAVAAQRTYALLEMLPRTFNALGLIAWNEGRYDDAIALFDTTEATASAVGDRRYVGTASGNRGNVLLEFGDLEGARQGLRLQRDVGLETENSYVEGNALLNLGVIEVRAGAPRIALAYFDSALTVYGPGEDFSYERTILIRQMADAYSRIGDHQAALRFLDSALTQSHVLESKDEEAADLLALGDVYTELGDRHRALDLFHQAEAMYRDLGFADELSGTLLRQAQIHNALNAPDRAQTFATEALRGHLEAGALFAAFDDLLFLSELAALQGDRTLTAQLLARADSIAGGLASRGAAIDLALARARGAESLADPLGVIDALQETAAVIAEGGFHSEWEAFALLARAHMAVGDTAEGLRTARRAADAADRVQFDLHAAELQSSFRSDKRGAYHALIDAFIMGGQTDDAAGVVERARGVTISASDRVSRRAADRTTELAARLRYLEVAIADNRLNMESTIESVRGLEEQVREVRSEFERVTSTYPTVSEQIAKDTRGVRPAEGDAILTMFVDGEHVHVFAKTHAGIFHVERRVSAEQLAGRVRLFSGLIGDPRSDPALARASGAWLFDMLIRPITEQTAIERLFVVPAGVLTYLPFDALWDSEHHAYAGERLNISALPSAADYADDAPTIGLRSVALLAPLTDELPASGAEVNGIHALIGGDLYEGRAADETRFRSALASAEVVHIATHGALNARNPMFTRIETAPRRSGTAIDDGRLEVHEVYGLEIVSALVFLSGCETALGVGWATTFGAGDDYSTLAEAFLRAGAGAVIATLWAVEDAGAAEFAKAFYGEARHVAPADALANARRTMMSHDRYSHPFYWAGYRITTARGKRPQNSTVVSVSP